MIASGAGPTPGTLVVVAALLSAVSGVPLLLRLLPAAKGQKTAAAFMAVAGILGVGGSAATLLSRRTETFSFPWTLPFGPCEFGIDPLSAWFLLPIFLIPACSAVYALRYWPAVEHPGNARRLTFFLGVLASAMAWVAMARNGVLFLVAWEIMALACYFALTVEDESPAVRDAGTLYLITTHVATLALFAMFPLLMAAGGGTFLFPPAGSISSTGPVPAWIFFTALFGFGMKAGLMPFHVWLPSAHANAPSHVSAVMSGVILKVGIYGLVRTMTFFSEIPLWWGISVLALGAVSGIAGVAFAIGQHDLKRLLAYHSIENVGIIALGIGAALIGRATHNDAVTFLGIAGALLHVLNHATFKALLFLGAGSVIHATGTREIDLMGGLSRRLPWTAAFFLAGAVAICGLPPLNGFVSELLIYLGLFAGATGRHTAAAAFTALAVPALALIGGLAVACFVKVYGVVFLGAPRSAKTGKGHGEAAWMVAPMALLALLCAVIGLVPLSVAGLLDGAVVSWNPALGAGGVSLAGMAPLGWITGINLALAAVIGVTAALLLGGIRGASAAPTWGCGYLRPAARIQYSASSFAELLVGMFGGILRPHREEPEVEGPFPAASRFGSHVPETVLEQVYLPFLEWANEKLGVVRRLQHGHLHLYILYTFLTLVALLAWSL
jgi:hydrogenase-4 component B